MPPATAAPRLQVTPPRVKAFVGALIGVAVGAVLTLLRGTAAFESLEWRLVDMRTKAFVGQREPDPEIIVAEVRNEDLAVLREQGYKWPWPLDITAHAFKWMAQAGARAVLVDVLQLDRGSGPEELGLAPADRTSADAAKRFAWEEADSSAASALPLAKAYRYAGRDLIVLAFELTRSDPEAGWHADALRKPIFEQRIGRLPPLEARSGFARTNVNLPVLRLLSACGGVGFSNALPDDDGVLRRAAPIARWGERPVPSLPLATAILARAGVVAGPDGIRARDALQPLSEDGSFIVAFRGPPDSFPSIRPADMVVAGSELPDDPPAGALGPPPTVNTAIPERVRGKIVVWGVNPSGVKDVVSAPIAANFPGPEYQATVLDNLLNGDGRVEVSRVTNAVLLVLLCLGLGALGGVVRRRGLFPLVIVGVGVALWFVAYRLFARGTSIDLLTPVAGLVLTYAGIAGWKALTEGRRNKWLEGTFSQYLSPKVIEALKQNPSMLALGGRDRDITVLFSDVKGFTSISEALGGENTVRLLNHYLSRQSEPVLRRDGVIDKFIGDAVMAFFGDPLPMEDHAARACRSAVESLAILEESQPLARELGVYPLSNRIGLASGRATVGNIGSDRRFNYTAIGDTVNLASRLEGANKVFGSHILLAGPTYEAAKDGIVAKLLARVIVVGKTEPVPVYELLAMRDGATPELLRHAEAFARAHAAVLADDLDGADRFLAEAEALRPGDGPSRWLGAMVDQLRAEAMPRPWDGRLALDHK